MQAIDEQVNRYSKDGSSELVKINKNAGSQPVAVSDTTITLLAYVLKQNQPEVDLTIGPVIDLWKQAEANQQLPTKLAMQQALALVDMGEIKIDQQNKTVYLTQTGMSLDFGAVAKGWAVEEAGRILAADKNITSAIVNGGGNIKVVGEKADKTPWRIGVQDPRQNNENIGILKLNAGEAVATSGDYQRYFTIDDKRFHHIISPTTGYPATENISVTILTNDALTADYYSTLIFILPLDKSLQLLAQTPSVHAIIINNDQKIYITPGLKERFEKNPKGSWQYVQK